MIRLVGSNQHQTKWRLKNKTVISLYQLTAICLLGIIIYGKLQPKIISPLSDNPVVPTVYAQTPEIEAKVKETLVIKCMRKFGIDQVESFYNLIFKESSFNPTIVNPTSGACGLFQSLPCSKMKCDLADVDCQIEWGLDYIEHRYGNPDTAWTHWQLFEWY